MLLSLTQPSMLSALEDLPSSSSVVCYVFGTLRTLRNRVNSWESLWSSLMRRSGHDLSFSFWFNFFYQPLIQNLTLRLQNSVIHGFIPSGRSPYYRPLLKAGSVVRVSRFEVARCTNMYKITDHPFVIRFIPQTTIDEVVANAPMINVEKFMIRKFDPLQALANTNLELPGLFPSTFATLFFTSLYVVHWN